MTVKQAGSLRTVAEIKQMVDDGTYVIDPEAVAYSMLEHRERAEAMVKVPRSNRKSSGGSFRNPRDLHYTFIA